MFPCYALAQTMETAVDADPDSDEAIKAQIAECQTFLEALESGNLHIGAPYEGRTEARIADLKRRIAMYQSILEKRRAAMPEDTDRVEGDGAAKAEAGAFPERPTATLQGVEGVESAIGYGMGGFGAGALNTEALNELRHRWSAAEPRDAACTSFTVRVCGVDDAVSDRRIRQQPDNSVRRDDG